MEIGTLNSSPLNATKDCPNCKGVNSMKYVFSWIEHDGFGHTGPPLFWRCSLCGHREDIEWKTSNPSYTVQSAVSES
jgi:hypothetical protein